MTGAFLPRPKRSRRLRYFAMKRIEEVKLIKTLGDIIGYGNLMSTAMGLWAIQEGTPAHITATMFDLTDKGKKDVEKELEVHIAELKSLGY